MASVGNVLVSLLAIVNGAISHVPFGWNISLADKACNIIWIVIIVVAFDDCQSLKIHRKRVLELGLCPRNIFSHVEVTDVSYVNVETRPYLSLGVMHKNYYILLHVNICHYFVLLLVFELVFLGCKCHEMVCLPTNHPMPYSIPSFLNMTTAL